MTGILVIVGLIAVVAFGLWPRKPRDGATEPEKTMPPQSTTSSDDAYRLGFGVGMRGGSIGDAVIAQNALRAVEQKTGKKADARTLGNVLGMQHPTDSTGGPS